MNPGVRLAIGLLRLYRRLISPLLPASCRFSPTCSKYFATAVAKANPDLVFCYVSGSGTDSTEKGKLMWARVKGRTENDLMKLPFKKVFLFRP